MSIGKIGVLVLAACLAAGGGVWAFADTGRGPRIGAIELDDDAVRRADGGDDVTTPDDDGPGGDGDDRTRAGIGDRSRAGDGDATDGNAGTGGGDDTEVTYDAPAGTATGGGTT